MELEGIDHVALSVRDVEKSAKWYIDVLGFKQLHEGVWGGIPVFIGKGTTALALFPAKSPEPAAGGVSVVSESVAADPIASARTAFAQGLFRRCQPARNETVSGP